MIPVYQIFKSNLDVVFFIYGLAFVIMGVAILLQPREESQFRIAGILHLLGLFAIIHGINEFLDMWAIIKGRQQILDIVRYIILITSFIFLFEFGRRLIILVTKQDGHHIGKRISLILTDWLSSAILFVILIFSFGSSDFWIRGTTLARYLLGFPAAILTGLGFISYYQYEKRILLLKVKKYFLAIGIAFFLYGILTGLVVPKGSFFPANIINSDSFFFITKIPVQAFRALCALVSAYAICMLIQIFNREIINRLKEGAQIKKTEDALREAELRHRMLFEQSPNGILVIDPQTTTAIEFNDIAHQQLGYSREEFAQLKISDYQIWERPEELHSHLNNILHKGGDVFEARHRTKDGQLIDVLVTIKPIRISGRDFLHCIFHDVSEQKEIERVLHAASSQWRSTFDAISGAICLVDREANVVRCNKATTNLFGKSYNEIIGRRCCEFLHGCTQPLPECPFSRMCQTLMRQTSITQLDDRWFHIVVDPVLDENRKFIGGVYIITEITESKKAEDELKQSYAKLKRVLEETVDALASAVEKRDPYTTGHQRRVAQLACAIAKEMNFNEEEVEEIRITGLLHDIGKIAIPSEILSKPGQLTEYEFSIIKTHCQVGYEILKDLEFPWPIAQIVLQHHERMSGSGYPQGLSGENIIMEARILAVADVVESMSSHRPYRPAHGIDKALEEILHHKGILYDSNVVDACMRVFAGKVFKFD